MRPEINEIINHIPDWKDAENIQVEPLAGLTNTNYAVSVNGENYVLRVSGKNANQLGIDRNHELEVLSIVSDAGIGAQIEHYLLPEGHLVTRRINGHHLTIEEYRKPENIRRILQTLKQLHALPLAKATFSPFCRVEKFAKQAQVMQVSLPHDFEKFREKVRLIEQEQARDTYPWERLCHNDLFCVNVLDDGEIRFIDWEFSGVGDIYYDLATLTYAYDSLDTLPRDLQEFMLASYFGDVTEKHWMRLEGMQYMLLFFTAMWGLLQQGMLNQGFLQPVEGFDFLEYANTTFESMRELL